MSTENGNSVNYTTKELIARVEQKVDEVLQALANKADKSQVELLERRVATVEMIGSPHVNKLQVVVEALNVRIANLEAFKSTVDAGRASRRWLLGISLGTASGLLTVILKLFGIL